MIYVCLVKILKRCSKKRPFYVCHAEMDIIMGLLLLILK